MPVKSDYQAPEEKPLELLPPNYYHVRIEDIEGEVKDFKFKNPDGSPQPPTHQFVIRFVVASGPYKGRKVMTWVRDSLFPQTKSKAPTLPKLLKAITGENFTVADRARVDPDFINGLITKELRISTDNVENKQGQEQTRVITFAPVEKNIGSILAPASSEDAMNPNSNGEDPLS